MEAIKNCVSCPEEADWLVSVSRAFMRPFAQMLHERARGLPISDPGWKAFWEWLDAGDLNVPWLPDALLSKLDNWGVVERLEIARRMALNHINSDLQAALAAHGIGSDRVWKCIGKHVDACQRKVVGGIAVSGDIVAYFDADFDVQEIRDRMRCRVARSKGLDCCSCPRRTPPVRYDPPYDIRPRPTNPRKNRPKH